MPALEVPHDHRGAAEVIVGLRGATASQPLATSSTSLSGQLAWSATPIKQRLKILRNLRHLLAHQSTKITSLIPRNPADTLAAELLPLLAAIRFLERDAEEILAPRRLGRAGLPFWLSGIDTTLERVPFGSILIIAPSNYPLFLPGVQAVQALAAGNAVVWKPGRNGQPVAQLFAELCNQAGLPARLLRITDESIATVASEIAAKPAKIVFTGSSEAGRAVQTLAATHSIPVIAELSGCDAVLVLPTASADLVLDALSFGIRLNDSATCMVPRRLIVIGETHARLLEGVASRSGPILNVLTVATPQAAIELVNENSYALTAAIFGDEAEASTLAAQLEVGTVLINDLIVPTADPRVPFGGRRQSGFGVTRGQEGLLEMTAVKVTSIRRSNNRRHYQPTGELHEQLFRGVIALTHQKTWRARCTGLKQLISAARKLTPGKTNTKS